MGRTSNLILCVGICLGVLGACLLVGFGIRYLKPYLIVRSMEKGTCTVTSATSLNESVTMVVCLCGRDTSQCVSQYRCVKVMVDFTSDMGTLLLHNVTLYDSYETFLLQYPTHLQCSFHKCDRVTTRNHKALNEFMNIYGIINKTYPCFYNPTHSDYAILDVVDLSTAVNTILWPSLALLVGAAIVLGYVFCTGDSSRGSFPSSSLDRVKNINRDVNRYERVETRYSEPR